MPQGLHSILLDPPPPTPLLKSLFAGQAFLKRQDKTWRRDQLPLNWPERPAAKNLAALNKLLGDLEKHARRSVQDVVSRLFECHNHQNVI